MSDDEKNPVNPVDEGEKGNTGDKRDKNAEPSNNKKKDKNKNVGGESEEETSDDEMSYEKWKAWRKNKKEQRKKKSSSRIIIDSSDDSDTDSKKRASRSSNKGCSSRSKEKCDYRRVAHDYTFSLPSEHNASIHMGKPPFFDGTGYNQWKTKMYGYMNAIHKDVWKVVEVGCELPEEDETPTPIQSYVLQRNFQALNMLHTSVSPEEFNKIEDAQTAKEAWDTLLVNHQGSRKVHESRIKTFALIAPVQPVLHQASCSYETIQNAPKHYETQQYMSLGSNGVGRVHSLR